MGRVEVAFDGTLPLLGLADVPGSHLLAGITRPLAMTSDGSDSSVK